MSPHSALWFLYYLCHQKGEACSGFDNLGTGEAGKQEEFEDPDGECQLQGRDPRFFFDTINDFIAYEVEWFNNKTGLNLEWSSE